MKINVLAFGIAREILGGPQRQITLPEGAIVADLRRLLETEAPGLKRLRSWAVAVNSEYAENALALQPGDEIAVIPPVSGG